jgi:DNA-binding PadR family transcriptional regulator
VEVQRLTDLEQLLLLSIARAGDDAHASVIRQILEERGERPVSLGSIYVTMTRLEERGMVVSSMGEPTARRGGKAKRLYAVTPEGMRALRHCRQVLDRMWAGLPTHEPAPGT